MSSLDLDHRRTPSHSRYSYSSRNLTDRSPEEEGHLSARYHRESEFDGYDNYTSHGYMTPERTAISYGDIPKYKSDRYRPY